MVTRSIKGRVWRLQLEDAWLAHFCRRLSFFPLVLPVRAHLLRRYCLEAVSLCCRNLVELRGMQLSEAGSWITRGVLGSSCRSSHSRYEDEIQMENGGHHREESRCSSGPPSQTILSYKAGYAWTPFNAREGSDGRTETSMIMAKLS